MTDSGNSGAGRLRPVPSQDRCLRCSGAPCRCLRYLAEAIADWAGVDQPEAARLAGKVWDETSEARQSRPQAEVEVPPQDCVFCGDPVRKLADGQIATADVTSNLVIVDNLTCADSPTHRHALP